MNPGRPTPVNSVGLSFIILKFPLLTYAYRVFLRAVTWLRDSHGLFDYESKSINKKSMKTTTQGKIMRISNDIDLVALNKSETEMGADAQTLL